VLLSSSVHIDRSKSCRIQRGSLGGIFRGFFWGGIIMTNQDAPFDLNDLSETFIKEMSDEALEAAASSGPLAGRSFTIAMCTGQAECPF